MKVNHLRSFYIIIVNLVSISSLGFGETFITPKPVLYKNMVSNYNSQSEGLKDKVTNLYLSISYGRFVNFYDIGIYLNGDMKPTKIQFTYPEEYRVHFNCELLTDKISFGYEYHETNVIDILCVNRTVVDIGLVDPVTSGRYYASHRFGILNEKIKLFDEELYSEKYLIWGMRGLKRTNRGLLIRGNFYINPFAYLLAWAEYFKIIALKDHSPILKEDKLYTYFHGIDASVGIPISSEVQLEFGFTDYDVFEIFTRFTLIL
ncbi:MAG: hypothetical protein P9X24_02885 [Candidatus Hatepunaea meridiana]|nr:hypothetical protein [Candidatus Hatepunaea meridiana]